MGQEPGFDGFAAVQPGGGVAAWIHVVTLGADVLFVREDGVYAVGRIDPGGSGAPERADGAIVLFCGELARPCPRTCGCTPRALSRALGRRR